MRAGSYCTPAVDASPPRPPQPRSGYPPTLRSQRRSRSPRAGRASPRRRDPDGARPVNTSKPAIRFIFITLLLDVLGFGLIIPVAPRLVQSLLHAGAGGGEGEAASVVGMLTATYAVMQLFFAPVLGALSDHFGRRPVLLVAIFGSGLDYFAMSLSPSLWVLFVTRAVNGLSGASMTVASAYIADVTPPEKRAAGFGIVGAAFGLGFVLGPVIGGLLGSIDTHYPFYAAGAMSLLNWLYGVFVLPESLAPENRAAFRLRRANPMGAFAGLARYPLVAGMAASFFLMNLAMFGLHATWVLYTQHRYQWNPTRVGLSLTLVGIGAAVVQAGLARRLIPALGERRSLLIGVAIGVLSYIGYGAATQGWMIFAIIALASIGGIAQPAAQSLITRTVRPDEQGATQGALTALQSVANILGPILGTSAFAYAISDRAAPPLNVPGLSFFIGAILCAAGWTVAAWATRSVPPMPASAGPAPTDPRP
ncbi:MAG: TCR/Tet family MFS transporter [Phycisphaerae bacterium]|nr:TCR/Tet family MFS transporter [Phycisphaerae bacterium]